MCGGAARTVTNMVLVMLLVVVVGGDESTISGIAAGLYVTVHGLHAHVGGGKGRVRGAGVVPGSELVKRTVPV